MINMPTPLTGEQFIYYIAIYIILLYYFNSLVGLEGLVEVVATCSRQPKLITSWKKILN